MADINKKKTVEDQNREPDNAGLQNKISNKQNPADTDKGSLSGKTSHGADGGSQRATVSTNGDVDRESVGELGTEKQREKNRILNEQVREPKANKERTEK